MCVCVYACAHVCTPKMKLTFDALDWRMRSLLSNCALYFFKVFRISCCCFALSNVGRRGRHCSPQKFSILSRFKIFPWNDQIQKPVSTLNFKKQKSHYWKMSQNWITKYIIQNTSNWRGMKWWIHFHKHGLSVQ